MSLAPVQGSPRDASRQAAPPPVSGLGDPAFRLVAVPRCQGRIWALPNLKVIAHGRLQFSFNDVFGQKELVEICDRYKLSHCIYIEE